MSKINKRRVFAEPQVFSAQEFEASGIRELSFEELLEVNGGKQVKDDPRTDKNSDTCPHSSNTPRESSSSGSGSSGGSSGGGASSGSSGSSSSSGSSGSYSSESSGVSDASGGSSASSGGGSSSYSSDGSSSSGGYSHDASDPSSNSGSSGSGISSSGSDASSGGSSSGSGSSGSYSGGGGSFDRSSSERDRDSDRDSGSWSDSYTPSGQSRESPKPNKGEEKSPTQGGGAPRGEAAATERNHGKNTGAINSGTKGGVLSGFKEFWGNAGNTVKNTAGKIRNKFGNVNKTNAESYVEKSRGGSWQSKENFPVPTAQGSKPSSEGYVVAEEQNKQNSQFDNKTNMNPIFPTDIFNWPRRDLSPLKGIAPEYRPLWPTKSKRITSDFGPDHNTGIDIGAVNRGVKGDAVVASMGGTVITSGIPKWSKSQSPYVIIKGDDKKEYRYVHLNISPGIFEGRRVNQGELIGSMSDNGAEGQVHLHFEIRDAGMPLSPIDLLP